MYLPAAGLLAAAVGSIAPAFPRCAASRWPWREALLAAVVVAWPRGGRPEPRLADDHALFLDMVAKVPRSAKAHYNLAYDAGRRGDRGSRGSTSRLPSPSFPVLRRLGDARGMAWADKRWDDAVALYRTSVEVHPAYENGLWGLARCSRRRAAGGGRESLEQAVAQARTPTRAYHHAAFLQSQGRFDDAEREWRRAVELVDEPADAYLGLARTLAARGRPGDRDAARREARRALAADPAHVEARRFVKEAR